MSDPAIRPASAADNDAIWRILEPTFREGATYPIPRDVSREDALAYWFAPGNTVFVAGSEGTVAGTYYLRANNRGGGAHVANCGYMTAREAFGRGVARAMCMHSRRGAGGRFHRDAVQFRCFVEHARSEALADLRIPDRRHAARRVYASRTRGGRCLCDVEGALRPAKGRGGVARLNRGPDARRSARASPGPTSGTAQSVAGELNRRQRISGTGLEYFAGMNKRKADPRLVWLASVLAAAALVIFLAHQA